MQIGGAVLSSFKPFPSSLPPFHGELLDGPFTAFPLAPAIVRRNFVGTFPSPPPLPRPGGVLFFSPFLVKTVSWRVLGARSGGGGGGGGVGGGAGGVPSGRSPEEIFIFFFFPLFDRSRY